MDVRALGRAALPGPAWVANHFINRVPYTRLRHYLYSLLGVTFEDRSSGCIMMGVTVEAPGKLRLGRNSVVGPGALLDARGGLIIGSDVNITGGTRFMTAKHDVQDPDFTARFDGIVVRDRAWVALGATVLGGVEIGEGAVVTASSTVTKDVDPFTIVGGTPAKKIGERTRDLRYELDYRPNWA